MEVHPLCLHVPDSRVWTKRREQQLVLCKISRKTNEANWSGTESTTASCCGMQSQHTHNLLLNSYALLCESQHFLITPLYLKRSSHPHNVVWQILLILFDYPPVLLSLPQKSFPAKFDSFYPPQTTWLWFRIPGKLCGTDVEITCMTFMFR